MAFTKITAAGIGSTETVTLDGLSVINNGSFGGNLTVGGVLTYEDVTNIDSVGLITARNGIVVGSGITLSKDGDGFYTGVVTATTFSGNFTGGTITGDGSALTGVASTENIRTNTNATFLQNVSIVGTSTVTGNIVPSSDSATDIGTNSVRFQNAYVDTYYGDGSNLTGISAGTALSGSTNNTVCTVTGSNAIQGESNVHIDSNGRLLVGTGHDTSRDVGDVSSKIQIEGAGYNQSSLSLMSNAGASAGNTPHLTLGKSRGSSNGDNTVVADGDALGQIQFAGSDGTDCNSVAAIIIGRVDGTPGSNDMPGRLEFKTTSDGAATSTERMRVDSTGNVTISDGDLVIGTSGHGISFSADSNATDMTGELLDDYEEGSWTPGSNTGTVSVAANGEYIKIGRLVQLSVLLYNWSDTSTATSILITGVPFSCKSGSQFVGQVWLRRTTTGNKNYNCIIGDSASNKINFKHDSDGSTMGGDLQHSDFAHSTPYTNITITYQTD